VAVSVRAILEGALAGVAVALGLAILLALIDYHIGIAQSWQNRLVWVGSAVTALAAGWIAGKIAETAAWIHGALAAVTLTLVGTVMAETFQLASASHIWLSLAVALTMGTVGGVLARLAD